MTKSHESIENDKTMVKRKDTIHKILNTENWKKNHQEPQRKKRVWLLRILRFHNETTAKLVLSDLPREHWNSVTKCIYMFNQLEMHCGRNLKLRSHNTSYCLLEVVTKAGLIVVGYFFSFLDCFILIFIHIILSRHCVIMITFKI